MNAALLETMRRISDELQTGRFREAHDRLEAVVAAHPTYAEALRLLAGTKLALGDSAAAEALLRRALDIDPRWTPTLVTLSELLLQGGRGNEAESLLMRVVGGSTPYPRAALLLARYYNDLGRAAEALAVAAPLCLSGNADAELTAQHVGALAALGRHGEAVAAYRTIVASAPNNGAAAQGLAIALNAANQHAEAEQVASGALARGPKTAALYNTHADSLIARADPAGAEAALQEALKLEPRLPDAQTKLAKLIWARTGDIAQATATLDRATQTFVNDDSLWAAKAALLQGAGDPQGAYQCLSGRAASPHAPPMLLVRAGLAALEFDAATALNLAERALRAVPENAAARSLLAAALLGVGDARAALAHCDALLTRAPDDQYYIALQTTAWRLLGDERYGQLCDYPHLVLPIPLVAPPAWPDLTRFLADVETSLNRLHDPDGYAQLFQSLRHGTETTQDLLRSTDPAIQALFGAFSAPICQYLDQVGQGLDPLRRRNRGRWQFNGSWSVRLRTAGHHTRHVHPRGWISSACYIALPDCVSDARIDQGTLSFGQPGVATNPALPAEFSVRPQVGMLVLFPSYFWHGTVPFSSTQARLTVAFDAVPSR
jgi:tetratricopeptide (TPR) repeat protein